MEKQNKQIDFSNQQIYAGIDVHKKSWKVTLRANKNGTKNILDESFAGGNRKPINKGLRKKSS